MRGEIFAAARKKCLHWRRRFGIICRVFRSLPHGVTVAQLTLDQFVWVRILVTQPKPGFPAEENRASLKGARFFLAIGAGKAEPAGPPSLPDVPKSGETPFLLI